MTIYVNVKTSDGIIWQKEKVLSSIIKASMQGPVDIMLLHEGPCCVSVGLDDILGSVIQDYGFDPKSYTIHTSNQIRSSRFNEKRNSFVELTFVQQKAKAKAKNNNRYNPDKYFGLFIGRSNWLRLGLACHLFTHYRDKTVMTYHYDPKLDYHISNFGLEDFVNRHWPKSEELINFLKVLPIKNNEYVYPILWDKHALDLETQYQQIFCDVVCETYYSGKVFFITEKTMRAILFKKPFLIQGPQWILKNLRSLGFKTFDYWWDEGYDEDPWDYKYQTLCTTIDYIASQSPTTIKRWHDEMQDTVEHNFQVLMNLKHSQIIGTQFYA